MPLATGAVMTRQRFQVIRSGPPAVDCYIGSLSNVLATKGSPISEGQLFAACGAFVVNSRSDEYGALELSFEFSEVIHQGMRKVGAELCTWQLSRSESFSRQLGALLQDFGPILVWVNTDTLPYMKDKYASIGYAHAVVVHQLRDDSALIHDSFVVDTPPASKEVLLSIECLETAVTRLSMPAWGEKFLQIQAIAWNSIPQCDYETERGWLGESVSMHFGRKGRVLKHVLSVLDLASASQDAHSRNELWRLLAYDITTDHVIPCRKLLGSTAKRLDMGEEIAVEIQRNIDLWTAAAFYFNKLAIVGSAPNGDYLARMSEGIDESEDRVFRVLARSL